MYDKNVIYLLSVFIVTFIDRACDSCVHKLYDAYYRCEIPIVPRPLAAVLTTQGMLSRLLFVNEFCNVIILYFVLLFVMLFFNIV